jgi:TPR repeat protein
MNHAHKDKGLTQNALRAQSLRYITLASQQNCAEAHFQLGQWLETGSLCDRLYADENAENYRNAKKALPHYQSAAKEGHDQAIHKVTELRKTLKSLLVINSLMII